MALSAEKKTLYTNILKEELVSAMGCTEPIAIAYAASILRFVLGCDPQVIEAKMSGNIIKNVKSVIVPSTGGLHGIESAIAAGIVAKKPEKKLEILTVLTEEELPLIKNFLNNCQIIIEGIDTSCTFDLWLTGKSGDNSVTVHIEQYHTNVVLVNKNGVNMTSDFLQEQQELTFVHTDRSEMTIADIITFADEAELSELEPLLTKQIQMNMAIAKEGLKGGYGADIGKLIYRSGAVTLRDKARAYAAAGSDARMSGCELPVCIISGSGNQGITASVPVVVYAKELGMDKERTLRALIVSDLITVHQKTGIGCLSAYCGAISAGCGAGCGICYLLGGRFDEIAHTLVNSIAILSGTICDGAKPSCAAKIAMAVEAGIMGYEMNRAGSQFYGGDGIVTKGVENTIRNVGKLARDGMSETDKEIIRIMLQ